MAMTDIDQRMLDRELKKGSAELLILALVEAVAGRSPRRDRRGDVGLPE